MNSSRPKLSLGALILAAGKSSRMGRPKMLLPWKETTVLGHHLVVWKNLEATQIAVVGAVQDSAISAELKRLSFPLQNLILNPESDRGMFSSIQCAARWEGWKRSLSHFAIVLGDQPHLSPETLRNLIGFVGQHNDKICQPSYFGRPRHPVILPTWAFVELGKSRAENLKQFLEGFSENICLQESGDPGLDLDLDHPTDYENLKSKI